MAISPIPPSVVSGFAGLGRIGAPPAAPTGGAETSSFGDVLAGALDAVSDSHAKADGLAVQAATGDLNAVHDYTVAATEAQLMTQLTVEVRNRAVDAFNDIMRMQV